MLDCDELAGADVSAFPDLAEGALADAFVDVDDVRVDELVEAGAEFAGLFFDFIEFLLLHFLN